MTKSSKNELRGGCAAAAAAAARGEMSEVRLRTGDDAESSESEEESGRMACELPSLCNSWERFYNGPYLDTAKRSNE